MFFSVKKELLSRCLETVEKALPTRSTIPLLDNILMESKGDKIIFSATNLEQEIKAKMPLQNIEGGKILLPPKIVDIVRHLPDTDVEVNINWDNHRIDLQSGPARYNLYGADASQFPLIEEASPGINLLQMDVGQLKQTLKTVIFAASSDETRPAFNGILFQFKEKGLTLTSSDTYRLVVREIFDQGYSFEPQRYLVPARALRELLRILPETIGQVSIFPHHRQLVFHVNDVYFSTRVLEEKYPDVSGVIPSSFKTRVLIQRKVLEDTVSRASLLAEGVNQAIRLFIYEGKLEVQVSSQVGRMEEQLPVSQEGENVEVYVNSRFVSDILKVVDSGEIIIDFHGMNGPLVFRLVEDTGYLYLVLPIKME